MDCKLPIMVVGGGLYKGMKGRRGTDAHSIQAALLALFFMCHCLTGNLST